MIRCLVSVCMVVFLSSLGIQTSIVAYENTISPPDQPLTGPGGSNYSHHSVKSSSFRSGASQYWIFEPSNPTPASAPLIIFNHGWSALHPVFYRAWIDHIVKRGNIVVYPRYQRGLVFGFSEFEHNAIAAVKDAIQTLQDGNHVYPQLDKCAIVGHSLGGGITVNMAARASEVDLPVPKAIMPVQPAFPFSERANLSNISNETLMLVIVGEDDTIVGNHSAMIIFYNNSQIPLDNKDFIIQKTDRYGSVALVADHGAPLALPFKIGTSVNAMDYYSTWKLFDALTDYAFYAINQQYCLGNTHEQRYMGLWSDGTPVAELVVTDTP